MRQPDGEGKFVKTFNQGPSAAAGGREPRTTPPFASRRLRCFVDRSARRLASLFQSGKGFALPRLYERKARLIRGTTPSWASLFARERAGCLARSRLSCALIPPLLRRCRRRQSIS